MTTTFERVGVVGGGIMGAGIAHVCALAGVDVVVCEVDDDAAAAARDRVRHSLQRAVTAGAVDESAMQAALDRIRVSAVLDTVADRELVIEAIVEREDAKTTLLARVDALVDDDAVLASNTSSIPIMRLAAATTRPHAVIGLHFFNPVPVMTLVEVIACLDTSAETEARAARFVSSTLGKQIVRSRDRAGFVVNALLVPYLLSAVRMLDMGTASADDIDAAMVAGCGHPMGPLALLDLIGLDTVLHVARTLHAEHGQPHLAPPPLLARMVEAGRLGRKTGRGFHGYG